MILEQKPQLPQTKEEIHKASMEFFNSQLRNKSAINNATIQLTENDVKICMGNVDIGFLGNSVITHDVVHIFGEDLFEITPYVAGNHGASFGPLINKIKKDRWHSDS